MMYPTDLKIDSSSKISVSWDHQKSAAHHIHSQSVLHGQTQSAYPPSTPPSQQEPAVSALAVQDYNDHDDCDDYDLKPKILISSEVARGLLAMSTLRWRKLGER